jgi:hypothetical protein
MIFFSSHCVQNSSEAHPASYPVGTGSSFPGSKARPGRDADHSSPSNAEVKNEQELYSSPTWRLHGGSGAALLPFTLRSPNSSKVSNTVFSKDFLFLTCYLPGHECGNMAL